MDTCDLLRGWEGLYGVPCDLLRGQDLQGGGNHAALAALRGVLMAALDELAELEDDNRCCGRSFAGRAFVPAD
jgi:hypothetical protein